MSKVKLSRQESEALEWLIAVGGCADAPSFSYTIGLSEKVGHELIVVGLPYQYAHPILNQIAMEHLLKGGTLEIDKPDDRFANLPVKFQVCEQDLVKVYGVQAFNYYGVEELQFIQMVMCDRDARFPEDENYDIKYMGPRQPLLYKLGE